MSLRGAGPINEDWSRSAAATASSAASIPNDPDLVYCESQNGGMGRRQPADRRAGVDQAGRRRRASRAYRFNWNTPFILSSHNSQIFYCGGNYVFRSVKQGDDLKIISPEITRTKRGSATALAESPRNPDVLWAGTDDGNLWVTKNGGKDWTNVAEKVGLPKPRWVATIEASRFAEGRAYVCFDAHRSDDDEPYVYVTEDFGQTWKSITGNLPIGSTRCLREDVENPNLLYCGTEFALFASLDRGESWTKINNNLPTVAVHEVAVHPTAGEIVAATHGRSLWILDVTALRQMTTEKIKDEADAVQAEHAWSAGRRCRAAGGPGRRFVGENPPPGGQVFYSLPKKAEKVTLEFQDIDGKKVAELNAPDRRPACTRCQWNMIAPAAGRARRRRAGGGGPAVAVAAAAAAAVDLAAGGGRQVPAGAYRVVLNVDGQEQSQSFTHRRRSDAAAEPDGGG